MLRRIFVAACLLVLAPFVSARSAPATDGSPPLKREELEQLAAPIALYPDALVSQILMASTYPIEVVEAERWAKANAGLEGDALATALNERTWDASVKSLVEFPDVLSMMSEKLDWTTKLGDAFLAQQKELLAAIQSLRGRASDAGNLETTEEQRVSVEEQGGGQTIVIESTSPDVIYVPQYDPVVVYGSWPYPSYPPYYHYPPGYVAGTALVSFGVGLACGAAWGWAWGGCNWGGGDIDIDIDRNANFNRNINRTEVRNELNAKGLGDGRGSWQHDASHRKGASYRDNATAQRYGRGSDSRAVQSREQYRGRAESGRQDLARGAGDAARPAAGDRTGGRGGSAAAGGAGSRQGSSAGNRSGGGRSAFEGSSRSGSGTRAASSRGSQSRSSAGGYSGGSRGGARSGGGSRGGGGGRGGGRGR